MTSPEHRAHFGFDIAFANGGGMHGDGFRLDLPSADLDADAIALLLVRHLGLALVESVTLRDLEIVTEPHRGSRGVETRPAAADRRLVDLSHPIHAGLITYPGLPAPEITPYLTRADSREKYAPGTEFAMDIITMIGNTGTYLDSPFHRYADGGDLSSLPLEKLVDLPAEVFHLTDAWTAERRGIAPETLADRDLRGAAVLLHTGWDRLFGTPEYGRGARRRGRRTRRHRLDQHRRHRVRRRAAGALDPARGGDPGRRASHRSRVAPGPGRAVHRRSPGRGRVRHVPRAGVRDRLTAPSARPRIRSEALDAALEAERRLDRRRRERSALFFRLRHVFLDGLPLLEPVVILVASHSVLLAARCPGVAIRVYGTPADRIRPLPGRLCRGLSVGKAPMALLGLGSRSRVGSGR